jgi:WD40 repeat protein
MVYHPFSSHLVTSCFDNKIRFWNVENGRCMQIIDNCAYKLAYRPDGQQLACLYSLGNTHKEYYVMLWDIPNNKSDCILKTNGNIGEFAYSPNGQQIATFERDLKDNNYIMRLWDDKGEPLQTLTVEPGVGVPFLFLSDQTIILSKWNSFMRLDIPVCAKERVATRYIDDENEKYNSYVQDSLLLEEISSNRMNSTLKYGSVTGITFFVAGAGCLMRTEPEDTFTKMFFMAVTAAGMFIAASPLFVVLYNNMFKKSPTIQPPELNKRSNTL